MTKKSQVKPPASGKAPVAKKKISVRAETQASVVPQAGQDAGADTAVLSVAREGAVKKKSAARKGAGPRKSASSVSTVSVSLPEKKTANLPAPVKQPMETKMTQKNATPFEKMAQDGADIGRECSEACMKSATILMKGCESIMSAVVSLAQASAEKQARYMKEALSSKTINEFADVQNRIAQAGFDDFMAGATKISELGVKIMIDSAEPVNAQMNEAVQKATKAMAA